MLMIHANVRKGQNKVQQQIFLELAIEIVVKLFEKDKWIEYEGGGLTFLDCFFPF